MMTVQEYEALTIAFRDKTLQALEALGWSQREVGRLVYHYIVENNIRHADRMEAYTLEREYSFRAYGHMVDGTASLDSAEVERIVRFATGNRLRGEPWEMMGVNLHVVFNPDGEVRHPHANLEESCMTLSRMALPDDVDMAAAGLAGAITRLVEVVDLSNALNHEWGVCQACGEEGMINSEHCGECDDRFCEECFTRHDCRAEDPPDDEPDEEPESREAERGALHIWRERDVDRAPRLPQAVGTCFLVGCGVTGSWVAPVLMRAARRLTVMDPDMLDGSSPHGMWTAGQGPKIQAVPFGRYMIRGLPMRYRGEYAEADLFVLCPDNAQARLAIDDNQAEVGQILDIRATTSGLTIWAVSDAGDGATDGGAWKVWRQSLEGYREPEACHHDNVPIKAGTLAAAFVAWWITSGRPDGLWTVPYGYAGMAFGQEGGE